MPFNAASVTMTLLALAAGIAAGVLAYAALARARARRAQNDILAIRSAIIDYFRRSGVAVYADCVRTESTGTFTALVESEPMKRFRLSHIIEMTLCEHVRKTCGLTLERVYWRFPIKEAAQAVAMPPASDAASAAGAVGATDANNTSAKEETPADEVHDEYINEGLENYRHIPKPEVTELPWETFEQVSITGREKKGEQADE